MKREFMGRERSTEMSRGARWFDSLDTIAKGELGDAFVLGDFDWRLMWEA